MWHGIIGTASFSFGIGLQLSGITSFPLGLSLMGIGIVLFALYIFSLIRERRGVFKENGEPITHSALSTPRVRPFSEDERLYYQSAHAQVMWNHGHDDSIGLRDDIWNARPLDGPCHVCGFRRIEQRIEILAR